MPSRLFDTKGIRYFFKESNKKILFTLLALDLIFILIHSFFQSTCSLEILKNCDQFQNWFITQDNSFSEIFQYLKYITILFMLSKCILKYKEPRFFAWFSVFIFLLLDDSLSLHERAGELLGMQFAIPNAHGLTAKDYGELLFLASIAVILFIVIALSYYKSSRRFRQVVHNGAILILSLALFGVLIDMIHSLFRNNLWLNLIFGVLEDGGEMIISSVLLMYFFYEEKFYSTRETKFLKF